MILYKKDFGLNTGILDYETSNKSFIRMAFILKQMGIQNNDFFLYLHQRSLQGIDPFSPNLDLETKFKIAFECKINPWYYFREVVRLPGSGTINGIPYILNRSNLSVMWCFFNHIDVINIIPRQLGKTVSIQAIISHVMFIVGQNIKTIMLTKDNELRIENVSRLREIRDNSPSYIINKSRSKNAADNTERIEYKPFNNIYSTMVSQKNKLAAEKKGRGATSPLIHIDEASYSDLIHITYPSMISAMNAAVENAKKHDQPHGILISTTMGRLDTKEGLFVDKLINKSFKFSESLYDLNGQVELEAVVKKNSLHRMIYCEFSYKQLGKTDEWFKNTIAKLNIVDDDIIKRDYLNIATYGTTESLISQALLVKLKGAIKDPLYVQYIDDYQIKWYLPKKTIKTDDFKRIPIILGMDSSENIGIDFTSLVFINATNGEVIGLMRCNETNIIHVALFIANFLIEYPNILFVPERNSTGATIVDLILVEFQKHNINPLLRIFNTFVQNSQFDKIDNINLLGSDRKYIGFRTTASKSIGRNFLLKTVLIKALTILHDKVNDSVLINEIAGIYKKNGKIYHPDKEHDDTMFGYIMGQYVLFFGKNLDYYTFLKYTKSTILKDIPTTIDPNDKIKSLYQKMKEELIELKEELKKTTSEILKMKLYIRIKEIEKELPSDELLNIDKNKTISVSSVNEKEEKITQPEIVKNIHSHFL